MRYLFRPSLVHFVVLALLSSFCPKVRGQEKSAVELAPRDPRGEVSSALRLYCELLERKDIEVLLKTALRPEASKLYLMPDRLNEAKRRLSGPEGQQESRLMRKAIEMKPRLWKTPLLDDERATFNWTENGLGMVEVDLVKEDGKWYLNW